MARKPVGKLLGHDIEVFGTGGENLRRKHWPSPSGLEIMAVPEEAFTAIVRAFSLDSIVSAAAGSSANRARDKAKLERDIEAAGLTPAAVSQLLIRRMVTDAIRLKSPGEEGSGEAVSWKWFLKSLLYQMDITALADREVHPKSLHSLAMRLLQAQVNDCEGVLGR